MPKPTNIYQALLRLYPARFRETYQAAMERQFADEYRETSTRRERIRLWLFAIRDLVTSAPAQAICELRLDLKHAIRAYRKRPLSTALAITALGLGIGASTGIFGVLNALLLRELPFSKPAQLAEIWFAPVSAMKGRGAFTAWYRQSSYLAEAAAFSSTEMNVTKQRDAFRIRTAETSANFFSLLGIKPVVGRTFAPGEEVPGHDAVAVIGYGFWQQFFAGDPAVIGEPLHLNGIRFTIIGVVPARFDYPGKAAIWTPTVFDLEKIPKDRVIFPQTIGRLKPGLRMRTAAQMFEAEALRADPTAFQRVHGDWRNRPRLVALQSQLAGPLRQASWALAGMIFLVLLTACANVAHLLLSRTTERRQELAVRAALGASRARILQQLITEATLLTTAGTLLGLIVAYWVSRLASSAAPAQLATQQYTMIDYRVLGFAAVLAVVLGILFGLAPAWAFDLRRRSGSSLQVNRDARPVQMKKIRASLIACQSAITLCLVTSSLVLGHTFLHLLHADLGFRPAGVVTLMVSLQGTRYRGAHAWQYYSEVLNRLRAIPGIEAAGAISYLPLANDAYMANRFKLDSGQTVNLALVNAATSGYFPAMGTSLIAGRDFEDGMRQSAESPVIVNQAFAKASGLGKRIVGRSLTAAGGTARYRITGVVRTVRIGPGDPGQPEIYWPIQKRLPSRLTFVARMPTQPNSYLPRFRDAVRSVDPQVPVYDVETLDRRLTEALAQPRFYTTATGFLALLALLLAAAGIYGTAAFSIAQRRHEMGVRMALGASYGRIRRMVLWESIAPVLGGIAGGIGLSLGSGQYLQHLVTNAAPPALWTCAMAGSFLLLAGLIAAWSASARVLSIDPVNALRSD